MFTVTCNGKVNGSSGSGSGSGNSITFIIQATDNQVSKNDVIDLGNLGTFKVIETNSTKTTLFPKYNLNIGPNKDSSLSDYAQSSTITGTKGQVAFSSEDYWSGNIGSGKTYSGNPDKSPYAYVFDGNSSLYSYATAYQQLVRGKGLSGAVVKLMTVEQADTLMSSDQSYLCNSTFWLGSARWGAIFITESAATCSNKSVVYNNAEGRGFRPIIEVATSQLLN